MARIPLSIVVTTIVTIVTVYVTMVTVARYMVTQVVSGSKVGL